MNLVKLGHKVKFYGYRGRLGRLANPVRMAITRSKPLRDIANLLWLNKINDEIKRVAEKFHPDLVLSVKGEAIKPKTIEWIRNELGIKTALWLPDDPRFFNSLVKHIAPSYDYVFTASEKMIPLYKEIGCSRVYFLPFACEETVHKRVNLTEEDRRKYEADVVFVGTYIPRRARLIKALEKAGVQIKVYGPYWKYFKRGKIINDSVYGPEMVKAYNAAKIVLNVHIEDDISYKANMRVFEAAGCGAFLLTDNAHEVGKMFDIGRELATYEDEEDLIELVKHYLKAEDERREISARAQERAYKEHTYRQRIASLINVVSK